MLFEFQPEERHWAEAHIQIVKMTLTIKFNRNWSSFQLANRGSDRAFLHLDKKRSRAPEGVTLKGVMRHHFARLGVCVCVCVFVSLVVPLIDCLLAWLCLARFVSLGLASFLMRLR